MAESEEELKSLLMKVKVESEKVGLKLNMLKTKIMASGPITSWEIDGETVETMSDFILGGLQNHCRWWLQPWNEKTLTPRKESYDQPIEHIKKQRHYFAIKGPSSQGYGFSSGHVWMWKLDCEDSWVPKNWCFWSVVLEKTLESPLDFKEIQSVHLKGDQSWVFVGRTDAKGEIPVLRPPHAKSWVIGKDSHAGMDWGQEEKGTTEHEMAGWRHRLSGHEFEWTPGVGDRQGGLACCDSWGRKELDTTERLNWTDLYPKIGYLRISWYPANQIHSWSLTTWDLSSFRLSPVFSLPSRQGSRIGRVELGFYVGLETPVLTSVFFLGIYEVSVSVLVAQCFTKPMNHL